MTQPNPAAASVKRYKIFADDDDLIESPDGEWVLHDDFAAAIAERDAAQKRVDSLSQIVTELRNETRECSVCGVALVSGAKCYCLECGALHSDLVAARRECERLQEELRMWKPLSPEEAEVEMAKVVAEPISDEEIDLIVAKVTDPTFITTIPQHVLLTGKVQQLREQVAHQTKCIDAQSATCARYATRINSIAQFADRLASLCYRLEAQEHDEDWGCRAIEFQQFAAEAMQEKPCKCAQLEQAVGLLRRWEKKLSDGEFLSLREFTEMHDDSASFLAAYDAEEAKHKEGEGR